MAARAVRSPRRARASDREQETRQEIVRRLRRIEGQVRGIQRMIDQDRACRDVLDQLAAIQQAVRGVSGIVAQRYALECIERAQENTSDEHSQETAAALVNAILRAPR
ncbi:MAG: metal-sensitive transcriptional regulator [Anaerolineae bacterium]|nr:metal-sensitive transcriptional regulator [Anaerolineae bacterium]